MASYECNGCRGSVNAQDRQTLMLARYGMTTWVHDDPHDPLWPEWCPPRMASPNFDKPTTTRSTHV